MYLDLVRLHYSSYSRCPVALFQQRYTYGHNQVLHILVSKLIALFADHQDFRVYANLNGFCFNKSPQETIPSTALITPYHPDLILYNSHSSLMDINLPSWQHIESAYCQKQQKPEYLQLLSELNITNFYSTVEVSILGYYLPDSRHLKM